MLAVEKWGVDKPKLVVMVAQQLASSSPAVIEMFQEWKSNPTGIGIQPDLKTWVKLYRQHRKIHSFLKQYFFQDSARFSSTVSAYADVLFEAHKTLQRADVNEVNKLWEKLSFAKKKALFIKVQKRIDKLYLKNLQDLSSDIENVTDTRLTKSLRQGIELPEFAFFMRVWVPCWLLHGKSPSILLRKARRTKGTPKQKRESLRAFEKLLRIDNSVIFDPCLSEKFHQLKAKKNKQDYRQLLHAFGKPPKEKIAPQKITYLLAGFFHIHLNFLGID